MPVSRRRALLGILLLLLFRVAVLSATPVAAQLPYEDLKAAALTADEVGPGFEVWRQFLFACRGRPTDYAIMFQRPTMSDRAGDSDAAESVLIVLADATVSDQVERALPTYARCAYHLLINPENPFSATARVATISPPRPGPSIGADAMRYSITSDGDMPPADVLTWREGAVAGLVMAVGDPPGAAGDGGPALPYAAAQQAKLVATLAALRELAARARGSWHPAATMAEARHSHSATLLADGRVLVAGGRAGFTEPQASAELYDPVTDRWMPADALQTPRIAHTATRLLDGRVLVVGGFNPGTLASAELYDPARGRWSGAASLTISRSRHAAILLDDGRVLVVGGNHTGDSPRDLESAELYDPATDRWTLAASMAIARYQPEAVRLADGRVLVTGGSFDIASAEVYDPATDTWSSAGEMQIGRIGHSATLLPDGRVLLAGSPAGMPSALAELYDPVAGTWTLTGNMLAARFEHSATLLPGGLVLVAGGLDGSVPPLTTAELYDPATGVWMPAARLSQARYQHSATLLPDGRVLVAGGNLAAVGASAPIAAAELYEPDASPGAARW